MKKLISILILSIGFASCQESKPEEEIEVTSTISGGEIVKMRGCEYIKSHVYLGCVYTHCGDCNNLIHKNK